MGAPFRKGQRVVVVAPASVGAGDEWIGKHLAGCRGVVAGLTWGMVPAERSGDMVSRDRVREYRAVVVAVEGQRPAVVWPPCVRDADEHDAEASGTTVPIFREMERVRELCLAAGVRHELSVDRDGWRLAVYQANGLPIFFRRLPSARRYLGILAGH